jgi:2-oxoglutaroyl-CoA hydrolase
MLQYVIEVKKREDEKIAEVIINRPEKMNSITLEMRKEIESSLQLLEHDPNVKVIIVKGAAARAFSAGGDIGEFLATSPDDLLEWGENLSAAERSSKPVIAQMNGYTFGAGLELALSCDIRIATPMTEIALPEIKLGMVPASGGITRLVKMLGLSRATYMLMLGKRIDAKTAYDWGLIHEVVDQGNIELRGREICNDLIAMSPLALKALKKVLRKIADSPFDAALDVERKTFGILRYSGDFKEGIESFMNKRVPKFIGE